MKKKYFILFISILLTISSSAQFLGSTFFENFAYDETGLQPQNWGAV